MADNGVNNLRYLDLDEPTDIEMAMCISRMLDDAGRSSGEVACEGWRSSVVSMAKHVIETMTNPYARKLLADQLAK